MRLFHPENRTTDVRSQRLYAAFEVWYTVVDFAAALCFIVGSVLFFDEDTATTATWMFLSGSLCFALKPTLRLVRELRLLKMGDTARLAERHG